MLNRAQKVILWIGVLACCFVIFVRPPQKRIEYTLQMSDTNYFSSYRDELDLAKLSAYLIGIALVTGAAVGSMHRKPAR